MNEEKRETGGARPRPYGGKNRSFATKLTEETMARLEKSAKAANMSLSQTAEAVLVQGLDARDDFQRHFAPALTAFEAGIMRSLSARDGSVDLKTWSKAAERMVARLSDDLRNSILEMIAEQDHPEAGKSALKAASGGSERAEKPTRRGRRILDVD